MGKMVEFSPAERTDLEKVVFELEEDWHGYGTESMWAERIDENEFRLRNSPFYAKGVSFLDEVETINVMGQNVFKEVLQAGGHSTYRIIIFQEQYEINFERFWEPLETIGCNYERATEILFAIDVPPTTDVQEVCRLLDVGSEEGVWDFEEGHRGHPG